MTSRIEQYRILQADADRRRIGQRKADVREWTHPVYRPMTKINAKPRRTFWTWLGEQMLIPQEHENAWYAFLGAAVLLVGAIVLGEQP